MEQRKFEDFKLKIENATYSEGCKMLAEVEDVLTEDQLSECDTILIQKL